VKRLALSLLIVIIVSVISLGWAIDQWYNHYAQSQEDPAILVYKKMGRELANIIDQQGNPENLFTTSELSPQIQAYDSFALPDHMEANFKKGEALLLDSGQQLTLHFYLPQKNSVLSLNLPNEIRPELPDRVRWILTLVFYLGVILVVLVWLYPLLKRLMNLQTITQAFGNGNLKARVNIDKNSYIRPIEQEFNRMAQRIEQLITDNKLLSRSLSHDLRTPLAKLRFGIDVLQEGELPAYQQQHLAHINHDLTAMESLIEAMLEYSRLDSAELKLKYQQLDWVQFTKEFIDNLQNPMIQLVAEENSVLIQADPFYLHSLLQNLTDNALKHAKQFIRIRISQNKDNAVLSIEDDGVGITDDERDRVLQPFYRSNHNEKPGYGLGLAIVNRIVLWHKGTIKIERSPDLRGAKIVIELNHEESFNKITGK
jgi:signal transduction histidine kinase